MEETKKEEYSGGMTARIQSLIDNHPVLVMATSTCPFCMEAKRTLAVHGITGAFIDIDKRTDSTDMRKTLVGLAGGKTSVPQIWINKRHVGGCDDLKALDASGDLAIELNNVPRNTIKVDVEAGTHLANKETNPFSAVSTYPGPDAAFFAPVHSPATMDHRAVRLAGVISFFFAVAAAVFANRDATQWVVLGLAGDFTLRLFGFPSPIGLLSQLPFAGTKPHFTAGASKQFAALCGTSMAFLAWAFLLAEQPLGGQIILAMLAAATFLQGFVDFCLGCFIFKYLLQFGFASKSTYRLHVNTRADTLYAWEKGNVRSGNDVWMAANTFSTKGAPPNPTDLRTKPRMEDEKWERFHVIAYCHMSYFMVPLSILGLAVPWAMLSDTVRVGASTWQAIAWTGVALHVLIGLLYVAKILSYPSKVMKEWLHPLHSNAFAAPFMNFLVMAWLATKWEQVSGNEDLARVLFWIGSAPLAILTIAFIARWVSRSTDLEYLNPSWMLLPVGNLVGALAARNVDVEYVEWGWFLFAIGILLWLALWPMTLGKSMSDHHSDSRLRSYYAVWIAPPAIAMLAYASLEESDSFDGVQRALFYSAVFIALVLGVCTWPFNFFLEGKFDMSDWSFAFPLDALAAASIIVYSYTRYDTMQVIYVVALTAACVVNAVNALSTLAALKARHIFTPYAKWSPLSFMKLTHEAFREAIPRLEKLAEAAKPAMANASSVHNLASAWTVMCKMHDIHSRHEEEVIFPVLEDFFPGQTSVVHGEHESHEMLMNKVQTAVDSLMSSESTDVTTRAALLDGLRADLRTFGSDMLEHLEHEEHAYATPIARKFLPISMVKDVVRRSWDLTSNADMSEFLGWAMSTLRSRGMRTRFVKTWAWAMPERAQLLGLMVYRVVDDVTWIELARDLPGIVPRGLPGHRRYF